MRALFKQIIRFSAVGIIAFAIDYLILVFLTEVLGVNYLISATVSFVVALVFNYVASMRYVFSRRNDSSRLREFVIFGVLAVIGLGLNDFVMWAGVSLSMDYRIVKFGASFIVMVYNFITRKYFFDSRKNPVATVGDSLGQSGSSLAT